MSELRVGMVVPLDEDPTAGEPPPWDRLAGFARQAEALGLDSLWVPDHLLTRFPGQPTRGEWEAWTVLAALAAVTERVTLGPWVSSTAFRNPGLLAKTAATVDGICGGRLILGIGAGWHQPEFEAFGFPFDHRVGRFAESLEIVHGLLRTGALDFAGRYHRVVDAELRPRGPREGAIPILVGARGRRMLELTARFADAWNAWASWDRGRFVVPEQAAWLDQACREIGRDPASVARTAGVLLAMPGEEPSRMAPDRRLAGSPDAIVDALLSAERAGISHVQVWLNPTTAETIEALAAIRRLLRTA
ncbi:MAG TPA: LLM class flavin-dependent oxidoreductase [Candidatus Limnocylindrales bacterium]